MLGFMAAAGSVMTCLGVTAYKNFFFHTSWRWVDKPIHAVTCQTALHLSTEKDKQFPARNSYARSSVENKCTQASYEFCYS